MILYLLYKNYKKNEQILPEFTSKNVSEKFNKTEKTKAINDTSEDANKNKCDEEENN